MKLKTHKDSQIILRCTKAYRNAVKKLARKERISMTDYIRGILAREIGEDGDGKPILPEC